MLPLNRTKYSGTVQEMKFAYMTYMTQERSGEVVTVDRNRENLETQNTLCRVPQRENK